MIGSIRVDEFGVIQVGSLTTFVKLNKDKQSHNCTFVNVKKSVLISPASIT